MTLLWGLCWAGHGCVLARGLPAPPLLSVDMLLLLQLHRPAAFPRALCQCELLRWGPVLMPVGPEHMV